jgi:hypothetical protein
VLWWCIGVCYDDVFWVVVMYFGAYVVVMYSVYWCVVFMSWCVMVIYLILGVNQMYWYVLWRYSVWCGDVIMFVVVKCKLILAKMRYLFILFVMCKLCNTYFFFEATRNWMHSKFLVKSDWFTPLQQFKLLIIVMRRIPNYE